MSPSSLYDFQSMRDRLNTAQAVLIAVHEKPDGDALGSACALAGYLQERNISFRISSPTPFPQDFAFLPLSQLVQENNQAWESYGPDVVAVVDSGTLKRAGIEEIIAGLSPRPFIINIDHHASSDNFGDINIVRLDAASTTEIIYQFFRDLHIPLTQDIATCLLNGMMTDTMVFHNAATSASVIEASSRLLAHGAKFRDITRNIFNNKKLATLKLWGRALSRLSSNNPWGIATTIITQEDLKDAKATEEDSSGLSNFLNSLDAKAVMVLTEQSDGTIKGSLRTTKDDVNVMTLAKALGGGGHKKAAGFLVHGRLEKTQNGFGIV